MEGTVTVMNLDQVEVWVRAKDFALTLNNQVIPQLPDDFIPLLSFA